MNLLTLNFIRCQATAEEQKTVDIWVLILKTKSKFLLEVKFITLLGLKQKQVHLTKSDEYFG